MGIISSLATEVVTWLNKAFTGTVLQGDGAFVLSTVVAFIIAIFAAVTSPGFVLASNWQSLVSEFAVVFASAQIWFVLVYQKLGLDIKAPSA